MKSVKKISNLGAVFNLRRTVMSSKIPKVVPEPIEALRVQIEKWRRNKGKKHRMPRKLWEAAALLANQYGVSLVAESLALGYASLKQKAHGDWGDKKEDRKRWLC